MYFSNPQLYKKFYMKDMNTPYEAESPAIEWKKAFYEAEYQQPDYVLIYFYLILTVFL